MAALNSGRFGEIKPDLQRLSRAVNDFSQLFRPPAGLCMGQVFTLTVDMVALAVYVVGVWIDQEQDRCKQ